MGSPGIGEAILGAVARVKAANPKALYCCDPVIGDVGRGVFVRPGLPDFFRERAIPLADVIAPNHFELDHLTGGETRNLAEAFAAIDALHARGPRAILVTSLHVEGTPKDAVDLVASGGEGRFRVRTPKLPISVNGAGDAIAALFFAHYLRDGSLPGALGKAASSVFGVLKWTAERCAREILLVEAQEEIVRPSRAFEPERLA
jgi:pyridoxine kinase